jgi:hypothetical protein
MAETLGSLIDKLSIKCIREHHLLEMKEAGSSKFTPKEIDARINLLAKQKEHLHGEIEAFVAAAQKGCVPLRDEKIKLYNSPHQVGQIGDATSIARAIDGLIRRNLELWNLEDEARRTDVDLAHIGKVKKAIDPVNQQRNDYMDRIDALLEQLFKK